MFKCCHECKVPQKNQIISYYCNPDTGKEKEQFHLFVPKKAPSPVFYDEIIELKRKGTSDHYRDQEELKYAIIVVQDTPFMQGKPTA
jgi:hypothetical protein